ncbi:RICIN domain-containing protein [Streptomyces abikoensis]|uniref:RICIN domain-containing protein n=1 Tax=Streptomyces abikoensis TaxID=97398 RepID=UPI0033E68012
MAALCALLAVGPAHAADGPTFYKTVFSTVDGPGPDARPVDPKELKRSPSAAPRKGPKETPQEVEDRSQEALKGPKAPKRMGLAAASGPPNPDRRDPAWCQNRLKVGEIEMHKTFDHWSFCDIQRYQVEYKECDGSTGKCKTLGTVNFRGTLAGEGHQGLSEDDRKLQFTVLLDDAKLFGETDLLKGKPLTLSMSCTVLTNSGSEPCRKGQHSGRSENIGQWMINGFTWFDFVVPIGSATDSDKLAHTEFRLNGSPGVGAPAEGSWTSRAGGARCDSNSYVYYGNLSHGCVFDLTTSVFSFVSRKETEQSAKHVREAQLYPDLTIPPVSNKSIPGAIESGKPLTRMRSGDPNAWNRKKSTAACRKWIAQKYSQLPGGPFDCDEYPFASTYEGSYTGDPDPKAMSHFSVRVISSPDNQQGGRDLNDWYVEQRIIDHDPFYVKVVKQDGSVLSPPAPPAPPKTPQGLVTGDMDDDGKPDLLAVQGSGKLQLFPGKGDGGLGSAQDIGLRGWAGAAVTHGEDFDGDDEQDVIARIGSDLFLYPGKGDGTIGEPVKFKGYGANLDTSIKKIVTISDATGDGYPDVIVGMKDQLWLYPGDPDNRPGLKAPVRIGSRGWDDYDIVAADDRNGDGKADLAVRNKDSGMLFLYYGPLNHELTLPAALAESPVFQLANANSNKCLEIENSSRTNGTKAQQWDCNGQPGANWQTRPIDGTGSLNIINAYSGKCLEVADSSKENGAIAQQWDCTGSEAQVWDKLGTNAPDQFVYRNRNSGKVLEVENSGKTNGAKVQQWDGGSQVGARWRDVPQKTDPGMRVMTPNQSRATRAFNAQNSPLIAAGHDMDRDGHLDLWATRYDGSLAELRDDPARNSTGSPEIHDIKQVAPSGWKDILALG